MDRMTTCTDGYRRLISAVASTPVDLSHPDVQYCHIWFKICDLFHSAAAVTGFTDHLDIWLRVEVCPQSFPNDGMVISEKDSDSDGFTSPYSLASSFQTRNRTTSADTRRLLVYSRSVARACSRSCTRSSMASMPTDMRTNPLPIPIRVRSSALKDRWDECAG